ncbi:MFS transporter [Kitasatospora sp. NPDC056181]|uniref:MFS transporter n=1 Tax=Kitasatospora sp. NPDC056181 TaxID=3345737 RepID=UPI0035D838D4
MPSSPRPGLVRDPDFGRLLAATAAGQLGDRIMFLALPLVAVAALDADELHVGLLTAMVTTGSLLAGLPAGAWVDRVPKRTVMISTDLVRALALATIPIAWWAGLLTVGWLLAVALVHGALTAVFDAAHVSYVPHLVGRGDLVEGNAKISAVRSVTSIGGPALAGPLVGWAGPPSALLASSLGMAVSGVLATGIRKREQRPEPAGRPPLLRDVKEGLTFVLVNPVVRATVLGDAFFLVFLAVYQAMLLVLLPRELGLDSAGIGLVLSGMGCGALVGALCARRLSARFGPGPVCWLAPLLTCPPTVLMPLAHPGWTVPVAAVGLAALSLGGVVRVVAQSSVQQALTPAGMLGRMSATTRFLSGCGLPVGAVLGGAAGAALGARTTLWIGAVGMTLSFVPGFASPLRRMRGAPEAEDPGPACPGPPDTPSPATGPPARRLVGAWRTSRWRTDRR